MIGRHWEVLHDGRVQCNICPRLCKLNDGQRGFCFVRKNVNQQIQLTTYGRSSGFCIDPIEKKPLNHFYPGTSVLSFGTAGCNLGCKFCQNWDISKARQMDRLMNQASPKQIAKASEQMQCKSVAFTYNDPVIFLEYATDTARACHDVGLKTVAVTAGYITKQARRDFYSVIDAVNIDLKAFTQQFYRKLCFADLHEVLDTIKYVHHETDTWMEITNLVIPQHNDNNDDIKRMCDWIVENLSDQVPVHFTAFHPDYKMLDLPRTSIRTLTTARNIAINAGLKYAYTGNVHDQPGDTTRCGNCGNMLIMRDWYQLKQYNMKHDKCNKCDHVIPGCFDEQPGNWGNKRTKVKINS